MASEQSRDARRAGRRAFRPELADGRLETRLALSQGLGGRIASQVHALAVQPMAKKVPQGPVRILTRNGGQGVRVLDGQHEAFDAIITGPGTVTAKPMKNGRVSFTLHGTTAASVFSISSIRPLKKGGTAHTFQPQFGVGDGVLEVAGITVADGNIDQILGYRTTNLVGRILVKGDTPVDRIALYRMSPGASIVVPSDLNTLDVLTDATLSGPQTGIFTGRDLNWFDIGGNLTLENESRIFVGRDLGLVAQGAKGTGPAGRGMLIQGNLVLNPGTNFTVNRFVDVALIVRGFFAGTNQASANVVGSTIAFGGTTP